MTLAACCHHPLFKGKACISWEWRHVSKRISTTILQRFELTGKAEVRPCQNLLWALQFNQEQVRPRVLSSPLGLTEVQNVNFFVMKLIRMLKVKCLLQFFVCDRFTFVSPTYGVKNFYRVIFFWKDIQPLLSTPKKFSVYLIQPWIVTNIATFTELIIKLAESLLILLTDKLQQTLMHSLFTRIRWRWRHPSHRKNASSRLHFHSSLLQCLN